MQASNRLNHIFRSLIDYKFFWFLPLVLGIGISAFYCLFLKTPTYTARQSVIVRDDLMGSAFKPSRFESLDSLKSAQETILEIARKPEVIRKVMEMLPVGSGDGGPISDIDIEEMQGNIAFGAPNGAEFGRTEAMVLRVTTVGKERARKFTSALLDEIELKLGEVRRQRLESMEDELQLASNDMLKSLQDAAQQLQDTERSFGVEITTMRSLNDPQGGSAFDLKLHQIQAERRQASATLASAQEQKQLLESARDKGTLEIVTSSQLLELQPALRSKLQSLTNAREKLSIDEGRFKSFHPALRASREAVRHQKEMLFESLGTLITGLDSQIAIAQQQVRRLDDSIVELEDKLINLTGQRVGYDTQQTQYKNRFNVYSDVQAKLSKIQSYANSSENVVLLNRVGEPQVGARADGLGKKATILLGGFLGLMIGLGMVALVVPPTAPAEFLGSDVRQTASQTAAVPTATAVVAQKATTSSSQAAPINPQRPEERQKTAGAFPAPVAASNTPAVEVKRRSRNTAPTSPVQPSQSSVQPSQSSVEASQPRPEVSSADVIAAIRNAHASKQQTPDPIQSSLEALAAAKDEQRRQESLKKVEKPEVVVAAEKTSTPKNVADATAAGSLTAESLIKSNQIRDDKTQPKSGGAQSEVSGQVPPAAAAPNKESLLQRVKAELDTSSSPQGEQFSSNRIPTVTEFAQSKDPFAPDEEIEPKRRSGNVRPADIVKSLDADAGASPAPTAGGNEGSQQKAASSVPIPEQIRKLSDSISSFARPSEE